MFYDQKATYKQLSTLKVLYTFAVENSLSLSLSLCVCVCVCVRAHLFCFKINFLSIFLLMYQLPNTYEVLQINLKSYFEIPRQI
jgi:hypothetical protein